jgi:hypothetical protein
MADPIPLGFYAIPLLLAQSARSRRMLFVEEAWTNIRKPELRSISWRAFDHASPSRTSKLSHPLIQAVVPYERRIENHNIAMAGFRLIYRHCVSLLTCLRSASRGPRGPPRLRVQQRTFMPRPASRHLTSDNSLRCPMRCPCWPWRTLSLSITTGSAGAPRLRPHASRPLIECCASAC